MGIALLRLLLYVLFGAFGEEWKELLEGRTAADVHLRQAQQDMNRDLSLGVRPLLHIGIMAERKRYVQSKKSMLPIRYRASRFALQSSFPVTRFQ